MWAALGAGALGRLVGNLSDTYGTGDTLAEKKRKDAESDYLARERQGIQARVEGAKAAGIHPLVAMGYQGGNSPSAYVDGGGPIQPIYKDPSNAKVDPNIARINEANARRAEAEASMAELSLRNANRNLANQPGNPPPAALPTSPANMSGAGLKAGVVVEPDKVTAGRGGLTAGTHPGATQVEVPGYGGMTVPSGPLKEALEDNELASTAMLLSLNRARWWKYLTDDIPWAIKGSFMELDRDTKKRARDYLRKKGRGGGATGSW